MSKIRLGSLDHIHIVVPDREEAAAWYEKILGFERVARFSVWAEVEGGGPLHMSADGGKSGIALFGAWDQNKIPTIGMGAAFKLEAEAFIRFAEALPSLKLAKVSGGELGLDDIIDFDLCYSFGFVDPYGNQLEVNCYDYDAIRRFIEGRGVKPVRYW